MSEAAPEPAPKSVPPGVSPLRRTLLEHLTDPASASDLARRLDMPRQKVNYHLRVLERLGLVEQVDERQRRGFVERRVRAVGTDRFSSAYLLTAASRLADDVAVLRERAAAAGKPILTFTTEVDIDFASPSQMHEFTERLADAVRRLAADYHRPDEARVRRHRVVIGAHPVITKTPEQAAAEAAAQPRRTR
ncbi:helix-turn-helix domain-containing protein [Actinomadura sp. 7K507]|uniref:ArsR/SmtB family transcription factor n=1 Tax=Actinomadura sp. 7K507 TaxID=2530365 RepID=UPI0010460A3A|nr:helix-turn-helix domain-containing protein [Actinomadura sp. 7K507]TDC85741.1 MarR family transcriptional regulator [Actinomadura sp. 7K507]